MCESARYPSDAIHTGHTADDRQLCGFKCVGEVQLLKDNRQNDSLPSAIPLQEKLYMLSRLVVQLFLTNLDSLVLIKMLLEPAR